MKVLLIDDEIVALNALKKRVDWPGYGFTEVLCAQDGAGARTILENTPVDLVMCDIEMPGESGLDLVSWIRQTYPQTECVMETCHADFAYLQRSIRVQVLDYLLKPIDYEELDQILRKFLVQKGEQAVQVRVTRAIDRVRDASDPDETVGADHFAVVKGYIDEHIHEKIYVEDLARLMHVSEPHFMRMFKRDAGMTVTDYIAGQRIALASDLLKNTDRSISFIASCIGCESDSYFIRMFKKYTGMTPREYRTSFSKG